MPGDDNNLFSNEELEVLMIFFLDQATLILETINKSLLALENNPSDEESLTVLQRSLHTLKGDANSVGFSEIGTIAHKLEDLLALFLPAGGDSNREVLELLLYGADMLGYLVQRKGQWLHTPLDISDTVKRINKFLRKRDGRFKRVGTTSLSNIKLNEYHDLQIRNAGQNAHALQIVAHFSEDCSMHAAGAFILHRQLQSIGEIVTTWPGIDEDALLEESDRLILVILTEKPEAVRAASFVTGVTAGVKITPISADSARTSLTTNEIIKAQLPQSQPHLPGSELPAEVTATSSNKIADLDSAAGRATAVEGHNDKDTSGNIALGNVSGSFPIDRRSKPRVQKPSSEILRVDVGKVNTLMDLVGELVISRSMLNQICNQLRIEFPRHEQVLRLTDVDTYLSRVLSEMQKSVMQVRMVSLDQTFNRFFRIVRDLGRDSGKQIDLVISGEDTELDKHVVDAIYEPLLHLVRNAVDHGIEPGEMRIEAGKPPNGSVKLSAYHQGDQVVIEVEDDGHGIDLERLKAKAVEKGLRTLDEVNAMQNQSLLELVFTNGLSTADRITELSGRGIGLDVVKKAVESLKGSIEIWTEPEAGTRFIMRLPLTLAIIKSMLFTVDDRVFAIPLSAVIEITRIHRKEMEEIGRHKVYYLRDVVYSLLELDHMLSHSPNVELKEHPFILIVGFGDKRVGLLVDRVLGEREIVVKGVDKEWITSDLITGASILGDGRVVLILDIGALMRKAVNGVMVK
jgi:two-component system, chemotaxis family, sensor kinase CheA